LKLIQALKEHGKLSDQTLLISESGDCFASSGNGIIGIENKTLS